MHSLLSRHFDGVTSYQFQQDLAEKNWIVLIERDNKLVGFTTILAYETSFEGMPVSVVYSGDTIVAPEAWNTATLPRSWIDSVIRLRNLYPHGPYVWLLLTSGFRTYRFLPVFWREFFPRFDCETPDYWNRLRSHLAAERFGKQYCSETGIVRFSKPQMLRGSLAQVPSGRTDDPHVAFFATNNPGYSEGDELVCLTELAPGNLTSAGRRMVGKRNNW